MSAEVPERLCADLRARGLTEREARALAGQLVGASSAKDAALMGIGASTVREYRRRGRAKLGEERLSDLAAAVAAGRYAEPDRTTQDGSQGEKDTRLRVRSLALLVMAAVLLMPVGAHGLGGARRPELVAVSLAVGLAAGWALCWVRRRRGARPALGRLGWAVLLASGGVVSVWRWQTLSVPWPLVSQTVALALPVALALLVAAIVVAGERACGDAALLPAGLALGLGLAVEEAWRGMVAPALVAAPWLCALLVLACALWSLRSVLPLGPAAAGCLAVLVAGAVVGQGISMACALASLVGGLAGPLFPPDAPGEKDVPARPAPWPLALAAGLLAGAAAGGPLGANGLESASARAVAAVTVALSVLSAVAWAWEEASRARGVRLLQSLPADAGISDLSEALLAQGLDPLQSEVCALFATGVTVGEVCGRLHCSRSVVGAARSEAYRHLGVRTRSQLVVYVRALVCARQASARAGE